MQPSNITIRAETDADFTAVHAVNAAAFPTEEEADLVDALRRDRDAWIDGLSYVAEMGGEIIGFALLTRSLVDGVPVLALAPCAVVPKHQSTGVGSLVITALLNAARERDGEQTVVVLGHPEYYPRFGFQRASTLGIKASFDVPDDAFMAMTLTDGVSAPTGTIAYPAAFGV